MLVFLIWFLRMEKRLRSMFYGLWLGVAGILFHSTIDFQLHIPALTLLFACIVLTPKLTKGGPRQWRYLDGCTVRCLQSR